MKQGTARSTIGGRKVEPDSKGMQPGGASQIGTSTAFVKDPINGERGYKAPAPAAKSVHYCGSQGKH